MLIMDVIKIISILFSLFCIINLSLAKNQNETAQDVTLSWNKLQKMVKDELNVFAKRLMPLMYRSLGDAHVDGLCQVSLIQFFMGIQNFKPWAIKMLDANAKVPSGMMQATIIEFGAYDECISIKAEKNSRKSKGELMFRGKHCMVGFSSPLIKLKLSKGDTQQNTTNFLSNLPDWIKEAAFKAGSLMKETKLWFGLCIPSTCSENDIKSFAEVLGKPVKLNVTVEQCQVEENHIWTGSELAAVAILSCLLFVAMLGTIVDIMLRFHKKYNGDDFKQISLKKNYFVEIVTPFSIYTNTEKLLSSEKGNAATLEFFNGIRFLSATWIVLGHVYFFACNWKFPKCRNMLGTIDIFSASLSTAVIENFTVPVSTFFFLSGFLMIYTTWRKLETHNGRLNVFKMLFHKYWRMTPAFVFILLLLFCMPLIDSGPIWNSNLEPAIRSCRKSWWINMLYFNNLWNNHFEERCLSHTWFLAALMQFHIIAAILIIICFRWPVIGIISGCAIAIISTIFIYLCSLWNGYPLPRFTHTKDLELISEYRNKLYILPFNHISAYLIGMCTGYLVLKKRNIHLKISHLAAGWILSIVCGLAVVYGLYSSPKTFDAGPIYLALHRTGWALALGWLTFACASTNGGIIRRILSWKAFQPLGKLSYQIYLIHFIIILYRNASTKERFYYGNTNMVFEYLAIVVLSCFIAYIGYVTVELPFARLESMLWRKNVKVADSYFISNQIISARSQDINITNMKFDKDRI